jgi:hypothetical protein
MIEPELGGDEKWLPASKSLGGRQENLFFHADVAEKPGSKLSMRSPINLVGMSRSRLKQLFKSPVVCHKKVCDRSCFSVLSWCHPLPPIMSSSEAGKGSREKCDTLTSPRADEASESLDTIFFPRVVRRQLVLVTLLRP